MTVLAILQEIQVHLVEVDWHNRKCKFSKKKKLITFFSLFKKALKICRYKHFIFQPLFANAGTCKTFQKQIGFCVLKEFSIKYVLESREITIFSLTFVIP